MAEAEEKYRGKVDDKRYVGSEVDVTFSPGRCIHAAECVNQLAAVFDVKKRPWIQPDEGSGQKIADVVIQCPSGALHFERKDGGPAEETPSKNVITVQENGYLRLSGDLEIVGTQVEIKDETRATLCRCGASEKKPFCDNSHRKIDFQAETAPGKPSRNDLAQDGPLKVTVYPDGPIEIEGNFAITNENSETIFQGEQKKTWLCRCGASSSKPFCDQSHKKIGFEAA